MKESVSPNTALSHYVILSQLGAGGMGEVYDGGFETMTMTNSELVLRASPPLADKR